MKKTTLMILFAVFALFGGCNAAPDSSNAWKERLDSALKEAEGTKKAVLVNFTGSDWCIWCKRLDAEVFGKPEFAAYAKENLVLVKIDFPRDKELPAEQQAYNRQLAQQYNIEGFPTIVLVSAEGRTMGVTGYQPGGPVKYIEHLKTITGN